MLRLLKRIVKRLLTIDRGASRMKDAIDLGEFPTVQAACFGSENPEINFYVIHGHRSGFFSNLQFVLAQIRQAKLLGMVPVVDYLHFPGKYSEPEFSSRNLNPWEYYFEPISRYSLEELYRSKNVFFCDESYSWEMGHFMSNKGLRGIYDDYIRPKQSIVKEVDDFFEKNLKGYRTLGVHFRGNEQNVAPGHPFCPTVDQMFRYTDRIILNHQVEKIYLVTEEESYLERFLRRYGAIVAYSDYYRTNGIDAFAMNIPPRKEHMYLLGKEIMMAGLLLSKCTGLLHSSSNVSQFARFGANDGFEFRYSIDNGVNSSNAFLAKHLYRVKRILPGSLGGLRGTISPPLD